MPRRNFALLLAVSVISLICYQKVQHSPYGRILAGAMQQVEHRYLEEIPESELFEGAMEGIISRLDEYSAFIPPVQLQQFNEALDQQFGGVGMEVRLDPQTKELTVTCPLVGTPAYEAGILAGDKIRRIDDKSTQGMTLRDAVAVMRGEPGSPVTLTVLHEGDEEPAEITIVRAIIHVDTVLGDTRRADGSWNFFLEGRPRIGYVRINSFADKTAEELRRAISGLIEQKMQGLILDLRNDPGGLLTAAIEVCDMFIDSGVIVSTRRRDGSISRTEYAQPDGTFGDFPMAVLVNHYSASASEIVAACLQDHHRAVVVGQRTWGKGTVQEVIALPGERGLLKLTTASYWRPSEKNIHRVRDAGEDDDWGVRPDPGYEVVVDGENLQKLRLWRLQRDVFVPAHNGEEPADKPSDPLAEDPQLSKAIDYVEEQIAKRSAATP
ncbi:MAG: S41 family peptidase [Pirellulales bacterium]|nr:S41 family peptidase [Pirellulales bacterium]